MLLSRLKVKDGRAVTRDEVIVASDYIGSGFDIYQTGANSFEGRGIEYDTRGIIFKGNSLKEVQEKIKRHEGELTRIVINQDSITEGSKIVVNTENHVNESAIAVTINESDCLVRFENGDEETVPIEAVSAFESMANDKCAKDGRLVTKDFERTGAKIVFEKEGYTVRLGQKGSDKGWFFVTGHGEDEIFRTESGAKQYVNFLISHKSQDSISEEIKKYEEALKKAKEEGNDEKILRIERLISQLKEDSKYNDSETESQIAELTKNMDKARARGYDTAPYQKEIDRLKSMDENNGYVEISPETGGYDISVYQNGNKIKSTWKSDQSSARQAANIFADYYRDDNGQSLTIKFKGKDKYTGDPLTAKGQEIMASLKEQYGEEKGEQVFYAMKNSGQIEGID